MNNIPKIYAKLKKNASFPKTQNKLKTLKAKTRTITRKDFASTHAMAFLRRI